MDQLLALVGKKEGGTTGKANPWGAVGRYQIKPGTDVAFYNGVMHEIIRLGLTDDEYVATRTSNFEALKRTVADYPPERAEQITGVPADTITRVAKAWGEASGP